MNICDMIEKKKRGMPLSKDELEYAINAYIRDEIPDYQMSALLMAVYFQGMDDDELLYLTDVMAHSGDMVDLSAIPGIKVDKHSTGGVGDKTTLIVAPIVAACGGRVAKMSGRGLGFTGGTVDKLESIPGYETAIGQDRFFSIIEQAGLSVMGQSADIAPADKKLYALRDVTGTVDSIPLIAASIMSKKLAAGSDKIVLDVTVGSGAFMKDMDSALALAEKMVAIGEKAGRETVAILTNMDFPLGMAVGNTLEVCEVLEVLKGGGPKDVAELSVELAANMLYLAEKYESLDAAREKASLSLQDKSAWNCFCKMVELHGGALSYLEHPDRFAAAKYSYDVLAPEDAFVEYMDTENCGRISGCLGAGRQTLDSELDYTAGIRFYKKTGSRVKKGEPLASLYSSVVSDMEKAASELLMAYRFTDKELTEPPLILARVTKDKVTRMV